MKRVLHIVGRMNRAGAETMLMNVYRGVDRSRLQFDFLYFSNERCDFDAEIEELGGRIFHIQSTNLLCRFYKTWRLLQKGNWRIVHSHTLFSSGLHLMAAQLAGVSKRIAHSHNTNDESSNTLIGRVYQKLMLWALSFVATDYVACGTAAAKYLFSTKSNVTIIPNAVNIEHFSMFSRAECKLALDLSDDMLAILQVGRLMPVKNYVWSVNLALELDSKGINFKMFFVGTGPDSAMIKELIIKHDLTDKIIMLGLRTDIAELMAAADIMLMPSLYEGFPVVLVEAQAAGLPSVISDTITSEVDLGLGLLAFLGLNAPLSIWVEKICTLSLRDQSSLRERISVFNKTGFSVKKCVPKFERLYELS